MKILAYVLGLLALAALLMLLAGCETVFDDQVPVTRDNAPTLWP